MSKIDTSIELLRRAESIALKLDPINGFYLAFSGGKDSQVIYHLAKIAGVKFQPVMNVTTIDPPEVMKFIRKNYPDVKFTRPDYNFYNLIIKEGALPQQNIRYCCKYLKESGGAGKMVITGVRRAESVKRSKRNEIEISGRKYSNTLDQFNIDKETEHICINGKDKLIINPILNWSNSDVWNFIRVNNIEYCNLYDNGYHRIGCIFCPMSSKKHKYLDAKKYPKVKKTIIKSINVLIGQGKFKDFENSEDVFNWWISGTSANKYLAMKNQLKLNL